MGLLRKGMRSVLKSNFLIKLRHWEYWPFEVVYFPIFAYWLWLSLKARSLLFFSASNPSIENGGVLGESKFGILKRIPDHLVPVTLYFPAPAVTDQVMKKMREHSLGFPIIVKPDIGERGNKVEKIRNEDELSTYLQNMEADFLLQEYIDKKIELGVFYYRYPSEDKGRVTSVVLKEMLSIEGDGESTVRELILKKDRAKLQWKVMKQLWYHQLHRIPEKGEIIELMPIGNHCRGATFLNGNHLINEKLDLVFDEVSKQIEGFYFGRYDIRCDSETDLYAGRIKIMELNGAGSEPAHIYHPGSSLMAAYKVLFHHWHVLYEISVANHKNGVDYLSFRDGIKEYKKVLAVNKKYR